MDIHESSFRIWFSTLRRGYIFPMVLFATLSVGLFFLTLTQLQSSNKARFTHLNDYQRAFNIAYSALIEVLADIQKKQWDNRSFKGAPFTLTRQLFGGQFNLSAEDHPGGQNIFNVKIRVNYAERYFLFYWRLQYLPDLLDFAWFSIPIYFGEFPPPKVAGPDDFAGIDDIVDEHLQKAAANREKAGKIAEVMDEKPTLQDGLKVIGIEISEIMDSEKTRPLPENLVVSTGDTPATSLSDLIKAIEPGQEYAMKAMQFAKDGTTLNPSSVPVLEALASYMLENPDIKILISGHTCNTGTADNFALSRRRAEMISAYLRSKGVAANRLSTIGYGPTRPIASNATPEGREKNRRAEFAIVK